MGGMSGFWGHPPSLAEVGKLLKAFVSTLQYSYLFGLLPALMLGAVDDIVLHIKRIGPGLRVLIVALIYYFGPCIKAKWQAITPGAIFTVEPV